MRAFIILFLILSAVFFFSTRFNPPAINSEYETRFGFSLSRAQKNLAVITQHPHPSGSSFHQEVQDYLLNELRALGLKPEIQETLSALELSAINKVFAGKVKNILVKIPAKTPSSSTNKKNAILFSAHYDSSTQSPGAGDNGAGVVTLLELARKYSQSLPHRNDFILLFPDAEESIYLGSKAFIEKHPWAKNVALAINLEARGSSGASVLYETSGPSSELIPAYASLAIAPVTSSWIADGARLLPNDSDFTHYRRAGIPGYAFAFGEGLENYHSPNDTLTQLDPRSLQHHLLNAFALAEAWSNRSLDFQGTHKTLPFFDVLRMFILLMPTWLPPLLALVLSVYFIYQLHQSQMLSSPSFRKNLIVLGFLFYFWVGICFLISALPSLLNFGINLRSLLQYAPLFWISYFLLCSSSVLLVIRYLNKLKLQRKELHAALGVFWILGALVFSVSVPSLTPPLIAIALFYGVTVCSQNSDVLKLLSFLPALWGFFSLGFVSALSMTVVSPFFPLLIFTLGLISLSFGFESIDDPLLKLPYLKPKFLVLTALFFFVLGSGLSLKDTQSRPPLFSTQEIASPRALSFYREFLRVGIDWNWIKIPHSPKQNRIHPAPAPLVLSPSAQTRCVHLLLKNIPSPLTINDEPISLFFKFSPFIDPILFHLLYSPSELVKINKTKDLSLCFAGAKSIQISTELKSIQPLEIYHLLEEQEINRETRWLIPAL